MPKATAKKMSNPEKKGGLSEKSKKSKRKALDRKKLNTAVRKSEAPLLLLQLFPQKISEIKTKRELFSENIWDFFPKNVIVTKEMSMLVSLNALFGVRLWNSLYSLATTLIGNKRENATTEAIVLERCQNDLSNFFKEFLFFQDEWMTFNIEEVLSWKAKSFSSKGAEFLKLGLESLGVTRVMLKIK